MHIAITGSTGLIGSALVAHLEQDGHQVTRIVRGSAAPGDVAWDPAAGTIDVDSLAGVDAVVHLAGAGVADHRWSAAVKETILASRVAGTTTLAAALAGMAFPPSVLVSASAIGYYGVRGDEVLTEKASSGTDFLADVCAQWEGSTVAAANAGVRVVTLRTGIVLSAAGGALKKQLPIFRSGLGAKLGHGRQQLSWITRRDATAAVAFLLDHDDARGPFNLTAPNPVSNAEFTAELGRSLHRPAVLAVPEAVLKLVLGSEMATETLLASQKALPERLTLAGFTFADPTLPGALATAFQDRSLVPHTP
jgi:uncharacterized protein